MRDMQFRSVARLQRRGGLSRVHKVVLYGRFDALPTGGLLPPLAGGDVTGTEGVAFGCDPLDGGLAGGVECPAGAPLPAGVGGVGVLTGPA